jgi:HlyD family secretion protein
MKRSRKKWIILGAAALVVVLVVVSVATRREGGMEVEVEKIERRDLTAIVSASGTVEPQQSVSIQATSPGEVVRIGVAEGQRVRKGQFLLQIDPVNLAAQASAQAAGVQAAQAELSQAEAQLAWAQQEYDRRRELAEAELIPRAELEQAEAELKAREGAVRAARSRAGQLSASLRGARHELSRVTITSPIDGIVTRLNVEEGEVAMIGTMNQPGTVLMEISDLGVMEATVDVDETDVVQIDVGQEARVTIDAFPDTTFVGRVTEVATSPKIVPTVAGPSPDATDFEVKITLQGSIPAARSGLSASAEIVTAQRDDALAIPVQSLVVRQISDDSVSTEGVTEREGVFVVDDAKAKFVPVRVGVAGDRFFEVVSGLEGGEEVVSGPYQALRDLSEGDPVKPTPAGEMGDGSADEEEDE